MIKYQKKLSVKKADMEEKKMNEQTYTTLRNELGREVKGMLGTRNLPHLDSIVDVMSQVSLGGLFLSSTKRAYEAGLEGKPLPPYHRPYLELVQNAEPVNGDRLGKNTLDEFFLSVYELGRSRRDPTDTQVPKGYWYTGVGTIPIWVSDDNKTLKDSIQRSLI